LRWIARHGFPIGRSLVAHVPNGARYLNVSQFPLFIPSYFRWLRARPDVKTVFFIHDLLPIETPEYFRKAEYERHRARLGTLAEFGSAAIVGTEVVKAALLRQLAPLKRADMPILVAPLPVAPIFSRPDPVDRRLAERPYFVMCGTIEPRKNHLLVLHVWRELVSRDGAAAPKLLLIGDRGWENENVVDLLERCPGIRNHVIEITGLSTPSLKKLLQGARALLMPSFAEGYGLPVAEALAAKVPVIASDIPSVREIGGDRLVALSPIDGEKWLETIRIFADPNRSERNALLARLDGQQTPSWDSYFSTIERFITDIP
jgi:glycosyltransferase involved in cell wall biosynthesis